MFGFSWGNYVYDNDWLEEVISPDVLNARVESAEKNNEGSISEDNLFVTVLATAVEHTFCHENDVRLKGELEDEYMMSEVTRYQEIGWEVYERVTRNGEIGGKWQLINSELGGKT